MVGSNPKSSPETLDTNFARPWQIMRPKLYRFMQSVYVDAFFHDGSIRISSFANFAKHSDEQRNDANEGSGIRWGIGSNMTIFSSQGRGHDAYVLCGTTTNVAATAALFPDCDACLAIDNILQFAAQVSLQLPFFVRGLEGSCIYQEDIAITKDIGDASSSEFIEKHRLPDGSIDMQMMSDVMNILGGPEEFFTKSARYASQAEYRLIWSTGRNVSDFIDIKVPDARQFCRKLTVRQ